MLYYLVEGYQCYGGTSCLDLQDKRVTSALNMEAVGSFRLLVIFYKITFLHIVTVVRTSNFTSNNVVKNNFIHVCVRGKYRGPASSAAPDQ
jgi:hypothetical protein